MSDKTCDNCKHREWTCYSRDVTDDENKECRSWQPIPVATTDTPKEAGGGPLLDVSLLFNKMCTDMDKANSAIAKRDDLIRRMTDELRTYPATNLKHMKIRLNLSDEANELLGVK